MKIKSNIFDTIFKYIKIFFTKGNIRTLNAKKNIVAIFIVKFLTIFCNMALVPVTLSYINPTKYGIWVTLTSIVGWFTLFDIGLGNGFKNRFAEAVAVGDNHKAKEYISTTYFLVIIISSVLLILINIVNPILDWSKLLNAPIELTNELSMLAFIVFSFFCIRLVVKLIGTIMIAQQKPAYAQLLKLIGSVLSLLTIIMLTHFTDESLILLGIAISASPVLVLIIASIILFSGKFKDVKPSLKNVKMIHTKSLMGLGLKFFVIQIMGIILYQSSNILISHFYGPAEVTPYYISYKYFSLISLAMGIILTPYWVAFTDAYTKKDIDWIKNAIKKLKLVWVLLFGVGFVMLLVSNFAYKIWVGPEIKISFLLSLIMFLYFSVFSYGGIYVTFLNGLGIIRVQLYCAVISSIIFISYALLFKDIFDLGIINIAIALLISHMYQFIVYWVQYNKIINNKAHGVWAK